MTAAPSFQTWPDPFPPIQVIETKEEAEQLLLLLRDQEFVAIDSEWIDHAGGQPVENGLAFCLQLCFRDAEGVLQLFYFHNHGESEGNIEVLRPYLEDSCRYKIGHNVPVDWHIVANHGIRAQSFDIDTMVLDHLLDENRENRHGLKECAEDFLGVSRIGYRETFGNVRLKKDGTPYASGVRDLVPLPEVYATEEGRQKLYTYACQDAYDTWLLFEHYQREAAKIPWVGDKNLWDYFWTVERPITNLIERMERQGMYLDLELLNDMNDKLTSDMQRMEADIIEWADAPVNVSSNPQMGALLYGDPSNPYHVYKGVSKGQKKVLFSITGHHLPVLVTTDGGGPSCSAEALKQLRKYADNNKVSKKTIQGLDTLIAFNSIKVQKSTFFDGLREKQRKSRIHGRINQIGTTSGRWSSSDPNLQNITTGEKDKYHLRECFAAPPGKTLIVADFSQLEYRLLAHFSQDPVLMKMFQQGWDMHSLTTYNVFPAVKAEVDERFGGMTTEGLTWVAEAFKDERKKGKTLNFEIIYGVGAKKLGEQLKISKKDAQEMIDNWFKGYLNVKMWMNKVLREASEKGFGRTLAGRYRRPNMDRFHHACWPGCRFRKNDWKCGIQGEEERTFTNALIQGSAADMCKKAMINIDRCQELHDLKLVPIMQVHDELIFEVPRGNHLKAINLIRPLMEQPFSKPLRVAMPVTIQYGPTWASAK